MARLLYQSAKQCHKQGESGFAEAKSKRVKETKAELLMQEPSVAVEMAKKRGARRARCAERVDAREESGGTQIALRARRPADQAAGYA